VEFIVNGIKKGLSGVYNLISEVGKVTIREVL